MYVCIYTYIYNLVAKNVNVFKYINVCVFFLISVTEIMRNKITQGFFFFFFFTSGFNRKPNICFKPGKRKQLFLFLRILIFFSRKKQLVPKDK